MPCRATLRPSVIREIVRCAMERDQGYTDRDMAEVSDSPEWTEAEFARARPFAEVFPDLAASLSSGIEIVRAEGSPRLSLALSGDVAAYYESFGEEAEAPQCRSTQGQRAGRASFAAVEVGDRCGRREADASLPPAENDAAVGADAAREARHRRGDVGWLGPARRGRAQVGRVVSAVVARGPGVAVALPEQEAERQRDLCREADGGAARGAVHDELRQQGQQDQLVDDLEEQPAGDDEGRVPADIADAADVQRQAAPQQGAHERQETDGNPARALQLCPCTACAPPTTIAASPTKKARSNVNGTHRRRWSARTCQVPNVVVRVVAE